MDTNVMFTDKDVGKNLYRKKTYYTLVIEQEVLANNKDEADKMFLDNGGIDHSEIKSNLAEAKNGVETYFVDADYLDSGDTQFIGKINYDDDTQTFDEAVENGDVRLDTYAGEDDPHPLTKIKLVQEEETI